MDRLTRFEIQRALLNGRALTWTNSAGKGEVLEMKDPAQRRLLAHILQSSVREPKGLPDAFVSGLSAAYFADYDPASEAGETGSATLTGPWRLQKIETEGFGGLNSRNGPAFSYEFDGESLILQGPNGSGKSSLVGAVLWAMTGERPRDYGAAVPEDRAEVYDKDNCKIGTWPPIACYPDERGDLTGDPIVRVTLTFLDATGNTAFVERRLENGQVTSTFDAALNAPDAALGAALSCHR